MSNVSELSNAIAHLLLLPYYPAVEESQKRGYLYSSRNLIYIGIRGVAVTSLLSGGRGYWVCTLNVTSRISMEASLWDMTYDLLVFEFHCYLFYYSYAL